MPSRIVTSTYRYKRPPKKRKTVALEVPVIVTKRTATKVAPPPANDDRKSAIVITSKRSKLRGEPVSPAAPAGYEEATAHYRAIIHQRLRK